MKIYIFHSSGYDYLNKLYLPLKNSVLAEKHYLFLPHAKESLPMKPNENILNFDCVLAEVSFPSTGQGIEFGLGKLFGETVLLFL